MRKSLINQDMYRNHFRVTVVERKSSQNASQGGIVFFWLREPYLFLKKKSTWTKGLFWGGCIHKPLVQPFVPLITQCQRCLCFNIFPTNRSRQPGHPKLPGIQDSRAQIMPQKSVVFLFKDGQHATKNSVTNFWLNQPIWKICSSNWIISPIRVENTKYLKPPPSWAKVDLTPRNLDSFLKRE